MTSRNVEYLYLPSVRRLVTEQIALGQVLDDDHAVGHFDRHSLNQVRKAFFRLSELMHAEPQEESSYSDARHLARQIQFALSTE